MLELESLGNGCEVHAKHNHQYLYHQTDIPENPPHSQPPMSQTSVFICVYLRLKLLYRWVGAGFFRLFLGAINFGERSLQLNAN
jgi:hypothetical protein